MKIILPMAILVVAIGVVAVILWTRRTAPHSDAAGIPEESASLPGPPIDDLPPISRMDLKALFERLDQPNPAPCTHTFKETRAFLSAHGMPVEAMIAWLQRHGAGCDCEVIFNTDAEWGEWAGRMPLGDGDE